LAHGEENPMRNPLPLINLRIGDPECELRVARWIVPALGLATLYLMAVRFPEVAKDRAELSLSILGAFLMFLMLSLGVTLSILLKRAAWQGKLRSRSLEYLSYAASLTLLFAGFLVLPTLGFRSEGDLRVGLMLLISTCAAVLSLGILMSVLRAAKA
jgi:hypothetical protein